MTASELDGVLLSTTCEDWRELEIDGELRSDFVYKQDDLLIIKQRPINFEEDKFVGEDWATTRHHDRNACKVFYDVYYGKSRILTKTLVDVDGGRARLPMPNGAMEISQQDYAFARIVAPDNLDEYIERSGLTVAPTANG